jgi:hypothetical protein
MKLPLRTTTRPEMRVYQYRTTQKFSLAAMMRDRIATILASIVISSGLMLCGLSLLPETWQLRFDSPVLTAVILSAIAASTGTGIVLLMRSFSTAQHDTSISHQSAKMLLPVKCFLFASFLCSTYLLHEQVDIRQNVKNELQAREDHPEKRPPFDRKEWLPF